jgi:hypothetical protein
MEGKVTYWGTGVSVVILLLALGGVYPEPVSASTESKTARTCPHQVGPQCQVEIARMSFPSSIESLLGTARIPEQARGKYRFGVATLKVTKPAGESLTLAAADLTLHYYHGDDTTVVPCQGLSWFKGDANSDAPILVNPMLGPGFISQTTGPALANSTVIYIDAVFAYMESDTRECWICVGRPTTTEPYVCPAPAWKDEGGIQKLTVVVPRSAG